ncbi:GntR family transcriptional regulator [Maritalea mobilis]|uniref:GntR family transcriptional regulator n=1 Tax=Maritalea mobilis TaxID=483324 RepID=UPI00105FF2A5|nr:GntR family transcriptional regulator [Maritalea mobilis]
MDEVATQEHDPTQLIDHLKSALTRPGARYGVLTEGLRDAIERGVLGPGDFLPAERELSDKLGLSRVTIRSAFKPLLSDGQLVQKRGLGTYVPRNRPRSIEKSLAFLNGFSEDIRNRGMEPSSKLVFKGVVLPQPDVAMALGVSFDTLVSCFRRIRYADSAIMAYELAYFPTSIINADHVSEGDSLYELLQAGGYRPVKAQQSLRAVNCTAELAGYLGVKEGDAVLDIERRSFDQAGAAMEFTRSYYRGDRYVFATEMRAE